jgi:hypothetical protein
MSAVIEGRGAIKGKAEGTAMVSRETIQGWSGVDDRTGLVVEKGHPFEGMPIKDAILILSGGKGSNGWSCHFHVAKCKGIGPAAVVFPKIDSRTAAAAAVMNIPCITDVPEEIFEKIKTGDKVRIDGEKGTIELV